MNKRHKPKPTTESKALGLRWTKQHRPQTVPDGRKKADKRACRGKHYPE